MQEISREAFTGMSGRKAADDFLADLSKEAETPGRAELKTLLNS